MDDLTKIKNLAQEKNYTRRHQYLILAELTGVTPEQAKQICSLQRTIRFAIPKDSVGEKLEAQWHAPHFIQKFSCEANNQYKLIS